MHIIISIQIIIIPTAAVAAPENSFAFLDSFFLNRKQKLPMIAAIMANRIRKSGSNSSPFFIALKRSV